MRRVVVLVLIFSLITCNTVVVLAANETEVEEPGTVSPAISVEGLFTKAEDEEYSIDILWGSMEFTYISNNEVWDVTSHQYVGTVGTWSIYDSNKNNVNKITVTNHSRQTVIIQIPI